MSVKEVNLDMSSFNTPVSSLNRIFEIVAGRQLESASSAYEWTLRLANFSRACPLSAYHPGLMWSWSRYESQRTEQSRSLMADITDYNKVTVKPSLRETTVQAIPALSLNSSIRAHLE